MLAPGPVPAVRMSIKPPNTGRSSGNKGKAAGTAREAFVDVVARGGAEWIRIYSKKNSALLAEFREQDSYLTSDEESGDEGDGGGATGATSGSGSRPLLDNSLTRLVDDLLSLAASAERIPGAVPPQLTLRLTRIQESPEGGHPDERIPLTLEAIRARGVKLVFGDLSSIPFSALPTSLPPPRKITPSRRLNLDPTALMGLCSDLLHHPLPADIDGARARFYRPPSVLEEAGHSGGGRGNWAEAGDEDAAQSQNSRELVRALVEEMEAPLVEVLRDALALAAQEEGEAGGVELWATREAVTYLQETISSEEVIGEGLEQRRMRRLTGLEDGDFWEGSRYEGKAGVLADMRLHIFDDEGGIDAMASRVVKGAVPPAFHSMVNGINHLHLGSNSSSINGHGENCQPPSTSNGTHTRPPLCAAGMTSFHLSTAAACDTFVTEYLAFLSQGPSAAPALPAFLNPRRLPSPRVAQISTPFTVVALHSLARGAAEGTTTLSMGHVVFRELFGQPRWRVKGWAQGNYDVEMARESERARDGHGEVEDVTETAPTGPAHAVAWIMPYRSLGEAKRVKFAQGDYSFPRFVQRVPKDGESRASTPVVEA